MWASCRLVVLMFRWTTERLLVLGRFPIVADELCQGSFSTLRWAVPIRDKLIASE